MDRRGFIGGLAGCVAATIPMDRVFAAGSRKRKSERWMDSLLRPTPGKEETAVGVLYMGRFRDPVYFLTAPISWRPNAGQADGMGPIEVPVGFVTDLASIPQVFWSVLRPDGEYAHAAVVHDYLYWTQSRPREVADEILKRDMTDLKVGPGPVSEIYNAVRLFGGSAWTANAKLKAAGERRILKTYPSDPSTLWSDWKKKPDVFA